VTTCDDVRPLLPEVALGTAAEPDDLLVRRHLRGCASCRRELEALQDGLGVFGSTLERPAPPELHDRVSAVLAEEWVEEPPKRGPILSTRGWRLAVAASLTLAFVAAAFGAIQLGRARDASADATSYRTILATLGGTGFKVGTLQAATMTPVAGSVVAYESSHDQSFVVVFVRTPELTGRGSLRVSRSDGTTWDPGQIEFDGDGDAAAWWVTDRNIDSMTGLTISAPDGSVLATASLRYA
jgi:predicted anti-sigma-YlaC factor YlaD